MTHQAMFCMPQERGHGGRGVVELVGAPSRRTSSSIGGGCAFETPARDGM